MEQQNIPAKLLEHEINLLELIMVLAKRKYLIIAMTLVGAAASVCYSLSLPNIYTASAKIMLPQKEGGSLSAALGQLGGLASAVGLGGGFGGSSELFVSILKSRSVADAVLTHPDISKEFKARTADDARNSYAESMKVQAGAKDNIITITANHTKPEFAARLVNATVEELGRRTVQLSLAKVSNDRLFLEQRLVVVRNDLKKAEEELKIFAQNNKAIKMDAQASATLAGIAKLKADLASKEVQLAAFRSYQTDESPEVQSLLAAIGRIKKEMGVLGGSGGDVGDGIPSVGEIPKLELEYVRRVREVKIQETILEHLTKQYEMEKINENRDTSSLQILDSAVVPDRKSRPRRSLIVILATAAAFFSSVFLSFTIAYFETLPDSDKEILAKIKRHLLHFRGVSKSS